MNRFASYPIVRRFTSIAIGLAAACIILIPSAYSFTAGQVVGFEDAQGKTLFLHDFKGKPVLINLWATWCGPCVAEMPSLNALQKDYAGKGLVVIALSEDDSIDAPVRFYQQTKLSNLPIYLDKGHGVWVALQAQGVPTTVLIKRDGTMIQRIEGPVNWESPQARAIIDAVIKE